MKPNLRRDQIMEAAIQLSLSHGYRTLTRVNVAIASRSSEGTVSRYFLTTANLKKEVLKEAVKREILPILVENLSDESEDRIELTPELQQKVVDFITS